MQTCHAPLRPSLRGATRRSNPIFLCAARMDCFAPLAMTVGLFDNQILPRAAEAVIARSNATKQSILSLCRAMDCFAALAMTVCGDASSVHPPDKGFGEYRRVELSRNGCAHEADSVEWFCATAVRAPVSCTRSCARSCTR